MALTVMAAMMTGLGVFGYGEGASYLRDSPASCANCHGMQASYDSWQASSHHAVARSFNMPAVMRGFDELSQKPYGEILDLLKKVPDETPETDVGPLEEAPRGGFTGEMAERASVQPTR